MTVAPLEEEQAALPSGISAPPPQRGTGGRLSRMAISGGAYLVGREAIGMVIRLLGVVVVVREMGPSSYGLYAAAAAYVLVIATVAQMGTEVYLIRIPEEPDRHRYNQAFTFLLVSSVSITAVALAATVAFGSFLRPVGVLLPLQVLLLTVPINVLWAPAQACIERRFGYKQMGILEVVGDLVLYGTAIPLAVTGAGEWSLVAGFFAWQLWLLIGSLVMSGLRPRWEWSAETMRTLTRHGLSFSSSSWISQLGGLVNAMVVGTFVGSAGVGYVAFAQRLVDTIGFAKRGAYRLGMVALSKVPSEDKRRLRYGIEEGSLLQLVVLAVPFAGFALVARWMIPLVFGRQWTGTIPVYSVLAVSAILSGPILIQITLLFTRGKNLQVALAMAVQVAVLAAGAVVLVHFFGILGYGLATVASLVCVLLINRMVRQITDFDYSKLLPFAVALIPLVLAPVVPLPTVPLLAVPMVAMACVASVRAEGVRIVQLVTTSLREGRR